MLTLIIGAIIGIILLKRIINSAIDMSTFTRVLVFGSIAVIALILGGIYVW